MRCAFSHPRERLSDAEAAARTALAAGSDLGPRERWRVCTRAAEMSFAVDAGSLGPQPALVVRARSWRDPDERDLLVDWRERLSEAASPDALESIVRELLDAERAYLSAERTGRFANEIYAIQNLRRRRLFDALRRHPTRMPAQEQASALGRLRTLEERTILGRRYRMDVGTRAQFWPYTETFLRPLIDLAAQTAPGSSEREVFDNRIREVLRRKTIFGEHDAVDETDLETTLGAAVVLQPPYTDGPGHRISLAHDHRPHRPRYEVLTICGEDLPTALAEYDGARLFRDGDVLRFDDMGADQTRGPPQAAVPASLFPFVQAKRLSPTSMRTDLGLRRFGPEESARVGISVDWDGNGAINLARILIGWWGHCHLQASGNAMDIDPAKSATVYVADRGVEVHDSMRHFTPERAWDCFGALAASHDSGYRTIAAQQLEAPVQIGRTTFVGARNDGQNHVRLIGSQLDVRINAELTELWKPDGYTPESFPPARFRPHVDNGDGTFDPNPSWIPPQPGQQDLSAVDLLGQRMSLRANRMAISPDGVPTMTEEEVHLDPERDAFVTIGETIDSLERDGMKYRSTEHQYNPSQRSYRAVQCTHRMRHGRLVREPGAPSPAERVDRLSVHQAPLFDGSEALHELIVREPGRSFTVDTSPDLVVWNHAVSALRLDEERSVERTEGDRTMRFTTYRLDYETVAGPGNSVRYILKRDNAGRIVDSMALDPMPDFAFRHDEWVMAPITLDSEGQLAINMHALEAGYLSDASGQMNPAVWASLGRILYASLSEQTRDHGALLFVDQQGRTLSFDSEHEFGRAVQADLELRRLEDEAADE